MQLHKLCKYALELEWSGGGRGGEEAEGVGGGQRWAEKGKGGHTMTHGVFNSLYLISNKVKDGTSDWLQTVLNHQSQLPKELLHGSLCPIILNMAGPKKLVLANLEGLA